MPEIGKWAWNVLLIPAGPGLDRVFEIRVDGPPFPVAVLQELATPNAIAVVRVHPAVGSELLPARTLVRHGVSKSTSYRNQGSDVVCDLDLREEKGCGRRCCTWSGPSG